jgi:hypothetical protein
LQVLNKNNTWNSIGGGEASVILTDIIWYSLAKWLDFKHSIIFCMPF